MIITVTLNPAIDKTVIVEDLKLGEVNRVSRVHMDAGGKGINVSKMIKNLGEESLATGIIAGNTGLFIKEQLNIMKIKNDFVEIDGNTRTNIKLVDIVNNMHTDINEPGMEIPQSALEQIEGKILSRIQEKDVLILSGSIPRNVGKDIYGRWIRMAKDKGAITILDAEGELLKNGVNEAPYIVKPNLHELEGLLNKKLYDVDEIVKSVQGLLSKGIKLVAVSMGEQGSVFVTEEKALIAKAERVEVKSTVGAGDSIVGALAYAVAKGMDLEKSARLAVAAATASVSNDGTIMGTLEQTEFWKSKISITEYIK